MSLRDAMNLNASLQSRQWVLHAAHDVAMQPTSDLRDARRLLTAFMSDDPQQLRVRNEMVTFLDAHPDALHRSSVDGHLTGSAVVVDAHVENVLLLFHRKLKRWLQPGGHADGDSNLAGVAQREASEETGIEDLRVVQPAIDLDIHEVSPPGEDRHLHLDVRFVVIAPLGAVGRRNHESDALQWMSVADLEKDARLLALDVGTVRLIERGVIVARSLV